MTQAADIYGLLKISKKEEHIEQLYRSGKMFFKTLRYFRQLEKDEERGDPNEGVSHFLARSGIQSLRVDDKFNVRAAGPISIRARDYDNANVFCMSALRTPNGIDERWKRFGDSLLRITNMREFVRRVTHAVEAGPELADGTFDFHCGLVEYVPELTYVGELGPGRKFERFAHQSEFRFRVEPGPGRDFMLTIGSLEDISVRAKWPS